MAGWGAERCLQQCIAARARKQLPWSLQILHGRKWVKIIDLWDIIQYLILERNFFFFLLLLNLSKKLEEWMQICLLEFAVRALHVWRSLNREYIPPPCASLTTARSCSKWLLPYLCLLPLSPIGKFCLHRWKNCPQTSQEKHGPFLCFLQDLSICHARKVSRTCCRSTSPPECRAVPHLCLQRTD